MEKCREMCCNKDIGTLVLFSRERIFHFRRLQKLEWLCRVAKKIFIFSLCACEGSENVSAWLREDSMWMSVIADAQILFVGTAQGAC